MRPHDGLLIVALLAIALAAGCKDQKASNQKTETSADGEKTARTSQVVNDPADGAGVMGSAAELPETDTKIAADIPSAAPAVEGASEGQPDPQDPDELARAKDQLEDLAKDAAGLRKAMLEANFKQPGGSASTGGQ